MRDHRDTTDPAGPVSPVGWIALLVVVVVTIVTSFATAGEGEGDTTPPPQDAIEPTEAATPNQGDDHGTDEDAHHELLMEALKAKGDGGASTQAILIAAITALGGIAIAVITTRRYCSRTVRRPKREERRPE